jgi:hypothetical protein
MVMNHKYDPGPGTGTPSARLVHSDTDTAGHFELPPSYSPSEILLKMVMNHEYDPGPGTGTPSARLVHSDTDTAGHF